MDRGGKRIRPQGVDSGEYLRCHQRRVCNLQRYHSSQATVKDNLRRLWVYLNVELAYCVVAHRRVLTL